MVLYLRFCVEDVAIPWPRPLESGSVYWCRIVCRFLDYIGLQSMLMLTDILPRLKQMIDRIRIELM